MNIIRLTAGQPHEIPGPGFTARLRIGLTDGIGFEVSTPNMESRRRGREVAVRNPQAATEIAVLPGHGFTQFPNGTKLFAVLAIEDQAARAAGEGTQLEFPTYEIGGLSSFTLAGVQPTADAVQLTAVEVGRDTSLDPHSAGVRSALRSSIDRDSLPAGQHRNITLLIDVSSSMQYSTTPEAFDAMCSFAAGVLATASTDRRISLATSSNMMPVEQLGGAEDVRNLGKRVFPRREVGWSTELGQIDPDDALVVISDDLPAVVQSHPGVIHLLSARAPVAATGVSATVFDQQLIRAVGEQNSKLLAGPTRIMYDTLTRGEK